MTDVTGRRPERPRLDQLAVRRLLRDEGLRARHSLSQNFLADPDVLEAILAAADVQPGERVLEIGPGLGILTGALVETGAAVTAVELDFRLAGLVRKRLAEAVDRGAEDPAAIGALTLIEGDALDQDLTTLVSAPYTVVANLPYHITSPILHRLLEVPPRPTRMVLMVQWEVAERIVAPPGRMSYLSVFVQYHAAARIACRVPAEAFEPAPSVASAVIVLEPHCPGGGLDGADRDRAQPSSLLRTDGDTAIPSVVPGDEDELWALVQAGFRERRKMVRNVLGRQLRVGQPRVDEALARVGVSGDRRPQTLSVEEWIALRIALDDSHG
ncbi:MAG: 16S rRNA (adenine(1518)-N(6)/adenine(1519)-N(6))-dimethyltransferase RsmA [Chloroflexota bacterium]